MTAARENDNRSASVMVAPNLNSMEESKVNAAALIKAGDDQAKALVN